QGVLVANQRAEQAIFRDDFLRVLCPSALVAAPLLVRGEQLVGWCLAYNTRTAQGFNAAQVQLFESIARHLALAVEAAELYRVQQDDAVVAATLAHVSQEVIAAADTPRLLDRLCQLTAEALQCERAYTWLRDADQGAYRLVSHYGHRPDEWESL